MNAPAIQVGALIELQTDSHGFLDETLAYQACRSVDADGAHAMVLVHGALHYADTSVGAARQVGAALATAARIEIFGNGPGVVAWAGRVQEFAAEERRFRALS